MIDLKKIVEKYELNVLELSKQLFPDNQYPRLALNRVIKGKALLDSNQLSKLALICNIPVSDLYDGSEWKSKCKKGFITLTNDDFKAELNIKTGITKVFHKNSLFHESIIHTGITYLSEYINKLESIVTKFKKK